MLQKNGEGARNATNSKPYLARLPRLRVVSLSL
jgi:hypothetical protein